MSKSFSFSTYKSLLKGLRSKGSPSHLKGLSLFLDFDGTLTPVAGHPDDAFLCASMREILIALKERYPVAIVTGRGLADIKKKVAIDGLTYVGNHGMEMSSDDFSFIYDIGLVESKAIAQVASLVIKLASSYKGAVVEEKGLTLSVHYRLVSEAATPFFLKRLNSLLQSFDAEGLVKITGGKGLVEVRPTADWDKGSAITWLMERSGFKGTVPLCIGDDETDEDAFRVIKDAGLSIFVGKRKNVADLNVPKQSEVEAVLAYLT
ncbi:MAG: trehalose-phosphatase [Proteobacteria bacterium]|nr:trehalose-phosphatase [Pseudomonadota bacterium]